MVELLVLFLLVLAVTKPLGLYLRQVLARERTFLDPLLRPVEALIYRLAGVAATREQRWQDYATAMVTFNIVGLLALYAQQRLQHWLPLNADHLGPVAPGLAWNTAVSFTTNTNWQAYSGESTMAHLTQMVGLTFHNFVSAATGMAVAVAVVRGVARSGAKTIGNFWVDLVRSTLFVLLPLSLVAAIVLLSQGVIESFHPAVTATTIEGAVQRIPQGPVASQEAIKELGTNGGGFFNANSAHPYENPTPSTDLLELFLMLCLPAGLLYMLGSMVERVRHGWAVFGAMAAIFLLFAATSIGFEVAGNPIHHAIGVPGPNMEGKEVRFGAAEGALWAAVTTTTSCGAVNAMHDSFTPLGGLIPLLNIQLGEVVFGGVGAGLYGAFMYIVLTVFIAGLMVGRTPEYLGKRIESFEVKMAMLAVLVAAFCILVGTAAGAATRAGVAGIANRGPHGLSEINYAFTSATGNNGSAFGGLDTATPFYLVGLGLAMYCGRFFMIVPMLAIAGSLAAKKKRPESVGTFPVDTPLFAVLLVGVILVVGALTFFPVLSLGPIVEHFLMGAGRLF